MKRVVNASGSGSVNSTQIHNFGQRPAAQREIGRAGDLVLGPDVQDSNAMLYDLCVRFDRRGVRP